VKIAVDGLPLLPFQQASDRAREEHLSLRDAASFPACLMLLAGNPT